MSSHSQHRQGRWSLTDLIAAPKGPPMEGVLAELAEAVQGIEEKRDGLAPEISESAFVEILEAVERLGYVTRQLEGYSSLWLAELTSDQEALAFRGRVDGILADAKNRTLFIDLWWKDLDEVNAARLSAVSGDVRQHLENLRRYAPYTLSEGEEQVINVKDVNGVKGLSTLYDMITHAFAFDVEIDGETKSLTRSELMVYARDPSPERREAAYRALYEVFGRQSGILGQIYTYVAGDWHEENVGLRGMSSAIAGRNLANDLPDDVVDVLLEACRKNAVLYQRFFRLKAGWLGMETLRRYDLYAPVKSVENRFPFHEGAQTVFDSLRGFSAEMADLAERVLDEGHLDSEVRSGKDTGAFCFGVVPDMTPWVLVNYNGRSDDVSTLAHELGHAVHAMLAADHSPLTFHSSLPLAETASNFGEILLLQRTLASETDPSVRRYLLATFVDDSYASILRQAYFVLFERQAHELINGPRTTVDGLADRYMENLAEQFGDSVTLSDEFRWEWTSIPHIYHVPFYCYAYSFGLLLVLALYREYERDGEAFVPRFLRILSQGGSRSPMEILDEAGINARTEGFWQGGFDVIGEMIDELEELAPSA